MITAVLKFGGNFFVIFVFYDFFRGQLKPRVENKGPTFLILLMCAAVFRMINSCGSSLGNLVFGLLILAVQMLLLFKDDGRRELFLLLTGESIALFMELVVSLFFAQFSLWNLWGNLFYHDQAAKDFMMGILSYLLCWIVLRSLKRCFLSAKCAMREHFPLSFFILPLSTALIYLGIFFGNAGGKWAKYSLNLGCILLPAANILMFYTINKLFFVSEKNREQLLTEQQTALQQRYYKHLEEINLGHRRYAHDLKNCMVSIGALAAAGGNEEIVELLGDMEIELDGLTGRSYTSNSILNALLWEKSALAGRHGVRMDIEAGAEPEWACIQGRDLIVMTGNLLDNAIEAAEQCEDGGVRVALYAEEHFLVMEVENSCNGRLSTRGEELLSTKPDAGNHGFGLSNVQDTAEKYGGLLYTGLKDSIFTAILTISKACLE